MTLKLLPMQVCEHSYNCPYVNTPTGTCAGATPMRDTTFICDFVDERGNFAEGKFRNPMDQTGKQTVLQG